MQFTLQALWGIVRAVASPCLDTQCVSRCNISSLQEELILLLASGPNSMNSDTEEEPCVGYVSFFSDTEREVGIQDIKPTIIVS
ncbi:hypothetical protein BKA82DRAFT_4125422 [Pisolithus tinctorius]|nr:hypothetical protein BKA82DRAFT_4125422 [Pisolithus tinctorius]